MENSSQTLSPPFPRPTTLGGSSPFYSSPQQTFSHGGVSLPLSPISFPPSPTSLSPVTAESLQSSSPLLHYTASQCINGQNTQYLSSANTSDQDDLTCLSWLHQRGSNLLPFHPLPKVTPLSQLESCTTAQPASSTSFKPPYSFSSLIFMAIEDSPDKRLPVKDIYEWIVNNFPYYRTASGGWRNSVRHNLSLSKSFQRIQRDKNQATKRKSKSNIITSYFGKKMRNEEEEEMERDEGEERMVEEPGGSELRRDTERGTDQADGQSEGRESEDPPLFHLDHTSVGKGSLWCVCPEYRPALLEVLRKTHSYHSTNSNLISKPALFEGADFGGLSVCDPMEISDPLSQTLLMSTSSPQDLTADNPSFSEIQTCPLTPDHEELVTMEAAEYQQEEVGEELEKDPLSDSGYIELHYYQSQQFQYLVLPGDTELDLETVEILQLDAEAQEAAGSLLDLAGGGY